MASDDLRRQADHFIELADLADIIGRPLAPAALHPGKPHRGGRRGLMSNATAVAEPPRDCPLCPRLVAYRAVNRAEHPDWWNGPAPSWGDPAARLLIVGLAPGRQGANRTGRPFTGDGAGGILYETLLKTGFATGVYEARSRRQPDLARLHDHQRRALRPAAEQAGDQRREHLPAVPDRAAGSSPCPT
jgi:hypothetical protein